MRDAAAAAPPRPLGSHSALVHVSAPGSAGPRLWREAPVADAAVGAERVDARPVRGAEAGDGGALVHVAAVRGQAGVRAQGREGGRACRKKRGAKELVQERVTHRKVAKIVKNRKLQ